MPELKNKKFPLLTSGSEPMSRRSTGRVHRTIKLGLSIDDDDEIGDDDDLPPLKEVEGADEASKMKEID